MKKKMKQFILLMLLLPLTGLAQVSIPEAGIRFELPNDEWRFTNKYDYNRGPLYIYKRTPITDSTGMSVISAIMVSVETPDLPGPEYLGLELFVLQRMNDYGPEFARSATHQCDKIRLKNAAAYLGQYKNMGTLFHTYSVSKYINGKYVTLYCVITSSLLDELDPEFTRTLASIEVLDPAADTIFMKPYCPEK